MITTRGHVVGEDHGLAPGPRMRSHRTVMAASDGMAFIQGGTFRMGSHAFYPEERPVRELHVEACCIDRHPVTVAGFRQFVKDTGYITRAERPLDPSSVRIIHAALDAGINFVDTADVYSAGESEEIVGKALK